MPSHLKLAMLRMASPAADQHGPHERRIVSGAPTVQGTILGARGTHGSWRKRFWQACGKPGTAGGYAKRIGGGKLRAMAAKITG